MKETQYIIVGQGIAGTLLSFLMFEKGIPHVVISDSNMSSASDVSAGMMNPLVFKRITKSWDVDKLLPFAKNVYARIEKMLGKKYVQDFKIAKILTSEDEVAWWKKRVESQNLEHYFDGFLNDSLIPGIKNVHQYARIKHAARVDISGLIMDYRKHLLKLQLLINEKFDYKKISFVKKQVEYHNLKANKIIFCEGAHIINNPFFNYIPFYLTKGDLLKVEIKDFQKDYIITKNKFLLPLHNDHYIFGSTYIRTENTVAGNDEIEREKLLIELQLITNKPFELKQHLYGVRPTIKDRRPVLGLHPTYNQLAVFNGLGTKGTMLAPFHANLILNYITGNINDIQKNIFLERF